jgi:hypothetical protein
LWYALSSDRPWAWFTTGLLFGPAIRLTRQRASCCRAWRSRCLHDHERGIASVAKRVVVGALGGRSFWRRIWYNAIQTDTRADQRRDKEHLPSFDLTTVLASSASWRRSGWHHSPSASSITLAGAE